MQVAMNSIHGIHGEVVNADFLLHIRSMLAYENLLWYITTVVVYEYLFTKCTTICYHLTQQAEDDVTSNDYDKKKMYR